MAFEYTSGGHGVALWQTTSVSNVQSNAIHNPIVDELANLHVCDAGTLLISNTSPGSATSS